MKFERRFVAALGTVMLAAYLSTAQSQSPSFGDEKSIAHAEKLWQAMSDAQLVGTNAFISTPYEGTHPHGTVLDTIDGSLTVEGHSAEVIVKRNYIGEGLTREMVANDPTNGSVQSPSCTAQSRDTIRTITTGSGSAAAPPGSPGGVGSGLRRACASFNSRVAEGPAMVDSSTRELRALGLGERRGCW